MSSVLLILAPGFEEIETVTPIDILRRASIDVTVASISANKAITGRNQITLLADTSLDDVINQPFDLILLPGGPGHSLLRSDPRIINRLQQQNNEHKSIAAICAAPSVLFQAGLLEGKNYTAHFSTASELTHIQSAHPVVIDHNITTSQGAGTATRFALQLVAQLCDQATADNIATSICFHPDYLRPI